MASSDMQLFDEACVAKEPRKDGRITNALDIISEKNRSGRDNKDIQNEKKAKKQRPIISPKLVFLKRKIKHLNKRIEADKESILGPRFTNTSIKLFIGIYAILFFARGFFRQYFSSILKHIQLQFTLSMRELEFTTGVEKIGFVIFVIFVGYYGNKMHKPLALLGGSMLCACGIVLCACPYFLNATEGRLGNRSSVSLYYEAGLCLVENNETTTTKTQCEALIHHPDSVQTLSFLSGGNFLVGTGSAFLLTLGFIYIEESSQKDTAPFFYGIILFINGLGECLGLIAAWRFIQIPYTLKGLSDLGYWDVGAWWLALPALASLFFFVSLPLVIFPKWIVEPKWMINRRNRQMKRWLYLLKAEEKLVNKIKRRQRRKKRKEEIARRKRESRILGQKNTTGTPDVKVTTTPGHQRGSIEGTEVVTAVSDISEATRIGLDSSEITAQVDEEAPVIRNDTIIHTEAEVHIVVDNGSLTPVNEDGKEASDDESEEEEEEEERISGPSSTNVGQPEVNLDDLEVSLQQNAAEDVSDAPTRGVHFATDEEGKILTESRVEVEDILQMEEPPQEPGTLEDNESVNTEKTEKERKRKLLGRRIQDLPRNLWFLINRPVFLLVLVGTGMAAYSPAGYQSTLTTYLLTQLDVGEPSNYLMAGFSYTAGLSLGTLVSGCVLYKRDWKLITHVRIILIIQCIVVVLFLCGMILTCDIHYFYQLSSGINKTYKLDHVCSNKCDCRQAQYDPICRPDGMVFPSSCLAGCRNAKIDFESGSVVYDKCLCVPDMELSAAYCNKGCPSIGILYAALAFIISTCQNFGLVSLLIICLRCIAQKLRSLALAFALFVIMMTAFVPGIAVFRTFQNVACVYKEADCVGDQICWHSDSDKYRYLFHGAAAAFQFVSGTLFLATILVIHSKLNASLKAPEPVKAGHDNFASTIDCDQSLGEDNACSRNTNSLDQQSCL